jgi:U3 small nucleolar RNA-associated protein 7
LQWNEIFICRYIAPDTIDDEEQQIVDLTQSDIKSSVDLFSAQKRFDLELPLYGPYHIDYTRNGRWILVRNNYDWIYCLSFRHLLLGGRKGHVAAFDWQTKKLHCEMNVMEQVNDVK